MFILIYRLNVLIESLEFFVLGMNDSLSPIALAVKTDWGMCGFGPCYKRAKGYPNMSVGEIWCGELVIKNILRRRELLQ